MLKNSIIPTDKHLMMVSICHHSIIVEKHKNYSKKKRNYSPHISVERFLSDAFIKCNDIGKYFEANIRKKKEGIVAFR